MGSEEHDLLDTAEELTHNDGSKGSFQEDEGGKGFGCRTCSIMAYRNSSQLPVFQMRTKYWKKRKS